MQRLPGRAAAGLAARYKRICAASLVLVEFRCYGRRTYMLHFCDSNGADNVSTEETAPRCIDVFSLLSSFGGEPTSASNAVSFTWLFHNFDDGVMGAFTLAGKGQNLHARLRGS